ncbi:MAG: threonine/serine exporter family protein [Erysipelothrix sp.]
MDARIIVQALSSFVSAFFFGIIVNVPRKVLFNCGFTGMAGWISAWILMQLGVSQIIAVFIGSILVSFLSIYFAKKNRMPATTFNIPGVFPLVPGIAAYQTVNAFVSGDYILGMGLIVKTFSISVSIALAIVMVEVFYRFFVRMASRRLQ